MNPFWKKLRSEVLANAFDHYGRTPMVSTYIGEENGNHPVVYLSKAEKDNQRLIIKGGLVYHNDGETLFHSFDPSKGGQYSHSAFYAIDVNGKFYAMMKPSDGTRLNHSSLLAGEDIICAGFISVKNGKVCSISNCSGHYKPTVGALIKAISFLKKEGVDLDSFQVLYEGKTSLRPTRYNTAIDFLEKVPHESAKQHSSFVTKFRP